MAQIIEFPGSDEREWRAIESDLRGLFDNYPNAQPAFEECMLIVREKAKKLFPCFNVSPEYEIPGPITSVQIEAIKSAVDLGVQLTVAQLRKERASALVALTVAEFRAAYYGMYGPRN